LNLTQIYAFALKSQAGGAKTLDFVNKSRPFVNNRLASQGLQPFWAMLDANQ
jgi:hypothetical protein